MATMGMFSFFVLVVGLLFFVHHGSCFSSKLIRRNKRCLARDRLFAANENEFSSDKDDINLMRKALDSAFEKVSWEKIPQLREQTTEDGAIVSSEKSKANLYIDKVSKLSASDAIKKFMKSAPSRVKDAMQTTVLGLLGDMKAFALDSSTEISSDNLASLMFQLQMTGYMLKNADYRLSIQKSLSDDPNEDNEWRSLSSLSNVSGKIKVTMEGGNSYEVDADAYVSDLRNEVKKLKGDLEKFTENRKIREEALSNNLLAYIESLPRTEMSALTSGIQKEVLEAMEALVSGIIYQFGVAGTDRIPLDSSNAMSKLCMWQMVIGYNLREIEVREQLNRRLTAFPGPATDDSSHSSGSSTEGE